MDVNGEVIVIEDDDDDQEILSEIFRELEYPNKIKFFSDGIEAMEYIERKDIHPFLILSDINMPKLNGFELRERLFNNKELHSKCIPYLFLTTGASREAVFKAYGMSVQGFFIKPNSIDDIKTLIKTIFTYWRACIAPSKYL